MATVAVVDKHGKGVSNQVVNLEIKNIQTQSFKVNNPDIYPCLDNTTTQGRSVQAITGPTGFAYIKFIPGEFNTTERKTATGTCEVVATWNGIPKTVTPIWKNYAYLSVTTWVDNNTVAEGQIVNVGVNVEADGPGLSSTPIDMIFCTDRGASMLWDTYDIDNPDSVNDKMTYVYQYGSVLLQELKPGYDRAGVVSFGPGFYSTDWPAKWPGDDNSPGDDTTYKNLHYPGPYNGYSEFAEVDHILTEDFEPAINNSIKSLRPYGPPSETKEKQNVPLRYGLYTAINDLIGLGQSQSRTETIKAIVLLTDPEWNDWGDPSAGWDGSSVDTQHAETSKNPWNLPQGGLSAWVPFTRFANSAHGIDNGVAISDRRQNLANYAKDQGIIIYTVAFPKKDVNIETSRERILTSLANSTGGTTLKQDLVPNSKQYSKLSTEISGRKPL